MKVRKFKKNPHGSGQLCETIAALETARNISAAVPDAKEFQERCVDAILALGNQLLVEYVEPLYEPEAKKFRVGYSVKWNFNGLLDVEAADAADAEKRVEARLDEMAGKGRFDDPADFKEKAEFDGADVLDTEEITDE